MSNEIENELLDESMISDLGWQLIRERGEELIRELEELSGKGTFIEKWLGMIGPELEEVAKQMITRELEAENVNEAHA